MSMKILAAKRKCLTLIIIGTKAKFYHEANKLVIGKMKDETGGVAIK